MDLPVNSVLLGPCLDLLKTLPDNSVDAVVTDPPYGLGQREPTAEDIAAYLAGGGLDHGGDFMGRDWEIPSVAVWKECLRVLKPGAYLFSFAGTRTWDLMSVGIRAAGFDNRDTIASEFGVSVLQWLHGQGFPKSLNVQKAMLKSGVDPEVAAKYEGMGSALKPAWEPILVFRKPLSGTVAENVVEYGTGALNIDGARVSTSESLGRPAGVTALGLINDDGWVPRPDTTPGHSGGRWPANVIFTHSEGCKVIGSKKVDAPVINQFDDGMKPFGDGAGHSYTSEKQGDEDGQEDVDVYECVDGCPVKILDEQSGELGNNARANKSRVAGSQDNSQSYSGFDAPPPTAFGVADTGGASRFFPSFDAPFFYTGKASKKEKNTGLDTFVVGFFVLRPDLTDEETDLLVSAWSNDLPTYDQPVLEDHIPPELMDDSEKGKRKLFVKAKPNDASHPTVKPVSLMRWLVRLACPEGGVVLDPYAGSGTTCVAAVEEGRQYIGMDRDPAFHKLATKRVEHIAREIGEIREQQAATAMMDELPQE